MNYLIDKLTNDKLVKKWCIGELMHGYLIMINGCLQATSWLIRNNSTEPIPSIPKDGQLIRQSASDPRQTGNRQSSLHGLRGVVWCPSVEWGRPWPSPSSVGAAADGDLLR